MRWTDTVLNFQDGTVFAGINLRLP